MNRPDSTPFGVPVVATHGETDPSAPLVVLLHGRGSNEHEILTLVPHLQTGVAYNAVRAPSSREGATRGSRTEASADLWPRR